MALLKNKGRPASKTEAVPRLASPEILARALLLTLLALAALPGAPAQAEVLVSNASQGNDSPADDARTRAQLFTTGTNATGYTLASVEIVSKDAQSDDVTVSVCETNSSGHPTSTCTALTAPSSFAAGTLSFTAPANTTLSASTTYAVQIVSPGDDNLSLGATSSNDEDAGGADDWTIGDGYVLKIGDSWFSISTAALRITINGEAKGGSSNNAPVFDPDTATRTIAENTAAGTAIGAVIPEATDADTGDTLTYSMEGTDAASFTFTAATRQLSTKAALDYEAKSSYTVTIKADDNNGGTDTMAVTINVTDVDEPPIAPAAPSVSATSGSTTGLDVRWSAPANTGRPAITSYDLQYRVGDSGAFTAGPQDQTGTSASITGLTAGTTYQVQVRATNDEGDGPWSDSGSGSTGTASNTAPTVANAIPDRTATVGVDFSYAFPANTFNDADSDTLSYAATLSDDSALPSWLGFTDSTRTFAGLPQAADAGTLSVKVTADDGNGGTVSDTFDIAVAASTAGICARTVAVQTAILAKITGVSNCAAVTATHLAAIDGTLSLSRSSLTGLKAGDFDGLTALQRLLLNHNSLSALPSGLFDDLTALTTLQLNNNSLSTLPSDIFDKLTALTGLALQNNPGAPFKPVANAGTDQSVTTGAAVTLAGTATGPWGDNVTWQWTQVDGASSNTPVTTGVTLAGADSASASFTAPDAAATLHFRLIATPVRATSIQGLIASEPDWVTVTVEEAANNAPVFNPDTATRTIAENTAANMNIGAAIPEATDDDAGDTLTYSMEGTDAASFNFDPATRQLSTQAALDFETKASYAVTIKVDDGNGGSDTVAVTITVTDVDEPPSAPGAPSVSATSGSTTSLDVRWTAPTNTGRPAIASYDLRYCAGTATDCATDSDFTAGPQDVTTTASAITGLTAGTTYQVQVRATNDEGDGPWSASGSGSTATPANNAPVFADDTATRSVAENTAANMNIGAAIPEATDSDGDTLTYSMEGTDAASFNFNAATRQLSTKAALDFEIKTSYAVTIKVDDGNGGSDTVAVTITVTDVDEPPSAPGAPSVSATSGSTTSLDVRWSAPANTGRPAIASYDLRYCAGTATDCATDSDFSNGPQDQTGTSASITGLTAGTTYQVQVRATNDEGDGPWSDSGSGSTGTAANNAPEFSATTLTRSIAENTAANMNIGDVIPEATDSDGDPLTYSMEGTDAASFTFTAASRQLSTKAALDFETKASYAVTIKVDDGNGGSDTVAVTITVTDVNEAPVVDHVIPDQGATAGTAFSFQFAANTFSDVDGDTLSYEATRPDDSALPSWLGFTDSTRTFSGTPQASDAGTVSVKVTAYDYDPNGEVPIDGQSVSDTFDLVVGTAANTPPAFSDSTLARSVAENAAANTAIGDPIPAATDADNDSLTYSMEGTDAASFTFNATSRQLSTRSGVVYDHEVKASYAVTIRASDGTDSDTVAVTISVTNVNEAPIAPAAPSVTATSGETTRLDVRWSAPANAGRPPITGYDLRYCAGSATDCATDGDFSAGPQDVTATRATIPGLTPGTAYQVQVRATNAEGDGPWSASGAGTTASAVANAKPEFTATTLVRSIAENAAPGAAIGAALPGATDADGDALRYTLEGADAAAFDFDAATRQLGTKQGVVYDHEAKASYAVTLRASDGRASATLAVTIEITDVNEPPGAPAAPEVYAAEDEMSLQVDWTAPDNAGRPAITGYALRYCAGSATDCATDSDFSAGPQDVTATASLIPGLTPGTTYQVQVRARNAEGAGPWSASGAGRVELSAAVPKAWLARFGRSVAEQVIEAVDARLARAQAPGLQVQVAGRSISEFEASDTRIREAEEDREAEAARALKVGQDTVAGQSGVHDPHEPQDTDPSGSISVRTLLSGTAFSFTGESAAGARVSVWGRAALAQFDGRTGPISLDGETDTLMLGADWSRAAWTTGVLLSHSRGDGDWAGAHAGRVQSTLSALWPYGRYQYSERLAFWGLAGYGRGELDVKPGDGPSMAADIDLAMGAGGLRGELVQAEASGGPALAFRGDVLGVRTASARTAGLAPAEADVTRVRLGLEGTWQGILHRGGHWVPSLEVGLRHDDGDAETGFGAELGAGLTYDHKAYGIAAEIKARGLLTHEASGFGNTGLSAALAWDPKPATDRGPSLTLSQAVGAADAGALEALLQRETMAGLVSDEGDDEAARRRLEMRFGYGLGVHGGRFTLTPELGFARSREHRQYRLGARLTPAGREHASMELRLDAVRKESDARDTDTEHETGLQLRVRF